MNKVKWGDVLKSSVDVDAALLKLVKVSVYLKVKTKGAYVSPAPSHSRWEKNAIIGTGYLGRIKLHLSYLLDILICSSTMSLVDLNNV